MKKFLVIYQATAEAMAKWANITPEEAAKAQEYWNQWKDSLGDNLVDLGSPLMPGNRIDNSGKWTAGSTSTTGFSLLQGETIDEVKKMVENHPFLHSYEGNAIQVHESVNH